MNLISASMLYDNSHTTVYKFITTTVYRLNTLEEPVLDTHYTILMKKKENRLVQEISQDSRNIFFLRNVYLAVW